MHTMHCGSTATADAFVPAARSGRRELLDAGDNAAFAWSFDTETYPKAAFTIRFADDQELDWEVGPGARPGRTVLRRAGEGCPHGTRQGPRERHWARGY